MKVIFHANHVSVADEDDYLMVAFADENVSPARYVLIQRSQEFDEQDVELGLDDVYIELDDQTYSAYGGITRCELFSNALQLTLDESTAAALGDASEILVTLDVAPQELAELIVGLSRIFVGNTTFVVSCSTD